MSKLPDTSNTPNLEEILLKYQAPECPGLPQRILQKARHTPQETIDELGDKESFVAVISGFILGGLASSFSLIAFLIMLSVNNQGLVADELDLYLNLSLESHVAHLSGGEEFFELEKEENPTL